MKIYSPKSSHIHTHHLDVTEKNTQHKPHQRSHRQLWLVVLRFDEEYVYGKILDSESCSRKVRIPLKQIEKWLFAFGGKRQGGFTILIQYKTSQELNQKLQLNPSLDKNSLTSPKFVFIDEQGFTQLHRAAIANDLPMMRNLIDAGWDTSIIDKQGKTALDYAKLLNHTEMIELLSQ